MKKAKKEIKEPNELKPVTPDLPEVKTSSKPIKKPVKEAIKEVAPEPAPLLTPVIVNKPKKRWKKTIILAIIFILLLSISACYQFFSKNIDKIIDNGNATNLYDQLQNLIAGSNEPLLGEEKDRVNILLLGIGGGTHDGSQLTDTIMIASIKPSTKQAALISLPRDLMIRVYPEGVKNNWSIAKINSTYATGGIEFAKTKVEEVTGVKINYYLLMDFDGFTKLIDDVGGIEVDAPNKFNGYYHITDCGGTCKSANGGPVYLAEGDGPYCIFKFQKGLQKMDGDMALKFARIRKTTRYTDPDGYYEGTDFARSKRQQKIIESFQKKVMSTSTLINPIKMTNLINDLGDHLRTDLQLGNMARLAILLKDLQKDQTINKTIDNSTNGLLYDFINPPDGAYFLKPNAGDNNFKEIKKMVNKIFVHVETQTNNDTNSNTNKNTNTASEPVIENADIIILNGTTTPYLAGNTAEKLKSLDLTISQVGNAPSQDASQTVIYDLTQNNPQTLATLKKELNANLATDTFASHYTNSDINYEGVDFIVVLGQDTNI